MEFETLRLPVRGSARRCCECGLVELDPEPSRPEVRLPAGLQSSLGSLRQTLEKAASGGARSLLLIGIDTQRMDGLSLCSAAREIGYHVTLLAEPGGTDRYAPAETVVHSTSLEAAPFLPDQFDVIIVSRTLESFDSPALLFERARLWLESGGLLLFGGMNWSSIGARLWRRSWLLRNARRSKYLVSANIVRRYADRFGYDVRAIHTYSQVAKLAGSRQSLLTRALLAPVTVAATVLGMGDELYVELEKRGVAVRAISSRQEEREAAPGLAPAMYRSARSEALLHQ